MYFFIPLQWMLIKRINFLKVESGESAKLLQKQIQSIKIEILSGKKALLKIGMY